MRNIPFEASQKEVRELRCIAAESGEPKSTEYLLQRYLWQYSGGTAFQFWAVRASDSLILAL